MCEYFYFANIICIKKNSHTATMKRTAIFTSSNYFDYLRFLRDNEILAMEHDYEKIALDFKRNAAMQNLLPAVVYILDYSRQRYFYMTEEAKRITGYSSEELIGMGMKGVHGILVKEDIDFFFEPYFCKPV